MRKGRQLERTQTVGFLKVGFHSIFLVKIYDNLEIFSVNSNSSTINKSSSRIFINEHLSKFNNHLLNHAKSLKNRGYKYVWYKFGKILVKETDSSETILIKNYNTVDDLIQKFQNKV